MFLIPADFELIPGTFIRRLNRFMVLVKVEGKYAHAHLPNSGRLTTALYPGVKLHLRRPKSAHCRKSAYSVFAASHGENVTIIIDAQFSSYLARKAIELGLISELAGYRIVKENIRPEGSNTRLDFLLRAGAERLYLEIKSVSHVVDGTALFPDAPTSRGRRHLIELSRLLRNGFKTGLIFSVQRSDAARVKPNYDVDPEFASLLKALVENGLKIFTLKASFIPEKGIYIWPNELPFSF
ncbi:MAG: DNA/RNA nuclease SfsA [Candidatus Bathyarchaeia archaeon]